MYTIQKTFEFCASHQLTHLIETQPYHQCARLHGHNYTVTIRLQSHTLNSDGFVKDFGELKQFKSVIDGFDHRHLNDLFEGDSRMTTSENLARYLYEVAHTLYGDIVKSVIVSETPKTSAEYSPHANSVQ